MDSNSRISGMLLSMKSLLLQPFRVLLVLGRLPFNNFSLSRCQGSSISTATSGYSVDPIRTASYKYDVFISFRGPDARNTFVDHLYAHLIRKGLFVFKDDKRLQKGHSLSPQLRQAIQDSRVSIVVFSERYAESTWCLEEMATIGDCCKQLKQTVFPVFYDVDPSHVRKQSGVYEKAFVSHMKKFKQDPGKVRRWMIAMAELAELVGWDVRKKPEFKEIESLVQAVIKTLGHKFSGFADDLVGIQPRVEAIESCLKLSSEDDECRVIGIWGMGGIGKTTLATVLYDRISYQFDACCFIENISKIYKEGDAIAVQKQILRQTVDELNLETYSPSEISGIVSSRLCNRKVLVVLDNVDLLEQVQELAINPRLLGAGSRMIITTRDVHILEVYGVHVVHKVPLMNNNDACVLFNSKAFKSDDATRDCVKLTPEVLKFAQGLPLAVRVVGSFLCTRNATQWRDALHRFRNNPDNKIVDVLQVSFEGLHLEDKEIFLHIACFFKGEKEDYVTRILDACELQPHFGIQNLIERSLITIRNQEIHMHEILQDLGKKIVRLQFPKEPGLWSRLWLYHDFHHVVMTEMGTNEVKAIILDEEVDLSEYRQLRAEGLSIMRGLTILILYNKNFSGSLSFLSNSLQYLLWHGYPFASLPLNFEPFRLVELNMPCSSIERLWDGCKDLPNLKRVDLRNSKYLLETPNFAGSQILERLDFTGCINLLRVHPSIGVLEKLAFLSLEGCSSLVSLDLDSDTNLCSLKVLHLSGCTKLESTPDFTGISHLEYLDIDQCTSLSMVDQSVGVLTQLKFFGLRDCTNLVSLPKSINSMTSLVTLDFCGCSKLDNLPLLGHISASTESSVVLYNDALMSSYYLESLIFLDLGFCNLSIIPDAIGELRHLERLNLEGNDIVSLPYTMSSLSFLAYLNLAHCRRLQSLPLLHLCATSSTGGMYFETVLGSHNHRSGLYIFNCPRLKMTEGQEEALSWLIRLVEHPCNFRCGFDIVVPGNIIPDWFNHQFTRNSKIRIVDWFNHDNWLGFAFCVAFEENCHPTMSGPSHYKFSSQLPYPLYLSFESEQTEEIFDIPIQLDLNEVDGSNAEHLWVIFISRPHCHFITTGAHITFKAHPGLELKKWGLRMVSEDDRRGVSPKGHLLFDYVDGSSSSSSSIRPEIQVPYNWYGAEDEGKAKIQLRYNWHVTQEDENENRIVSQKQQSLSNTGLSVTEERSHEVVIQSGDISPPSLVSGDISTHISTPSLVWGDISTPSLVSGDISPMSGDISPSPVSGDISPNVGLYISRVG